ncbi:MAG: ATP-binding protein [Pseudonocardiales bacterium]|nr:MAG: ATP-binding protein [Pseudonocardiales bacterium]
MQPSPYTPGEVAREIPGRAVQLAQMEERLAYLIDLQRLVGRIRVDVAARGIGKTSLLREVQRRAEARGALTVWVTAGEDMGLIPALAAEIHRKTHDWKADTRARLRELLEHLTVSLGVPGIARVEATWAAGAAAGGVREFEEVVRETAASARDEGRSGVVLFIDEIQSADADGLRTLGYAWQHLQSEGSDVPAAVFAAGLPNSPEVIANVVTFSERFAYRPLERLPPDAAMIALGGAARALGVEWDSAALAEAVATAQGYPYTLQLIGDATWAAAGYPDAGARLTIEHLQQGSVAMSADLNALFRARWEKATAGEQAFIRAMAALGDGLVRRADVARVMGVTSDELSVPRARLIDKGLIDVAGRGELQFTIPGFAEFVRSYTDGSTAIPQD